MFDLDLQAVGRLEELKSRVRREMEDLFRGATGRAAR